eukprot:SM000197S05443  [mRNA]  locus=s197:4811:9880:+ [translate_table: standard]
MDVALAFLGVGCNRTARALAWGPHGLAAFAAHHAVAIYLPQAARLLLTLRGHTARVNCVEWLPSHRRLPPPHFQWAQLQLLLNAHQDAVTCIAGQLLPGGIALVATTASDMNTKIWSGSYQQPQGLQLECLQTIQTGARMMSAVTLSSPFGGNRIIMAVGGVDSSIYLYLGGQHAEFKILCNLRGHQDWVRSLDFSALCQGGPGGHEGAIYLASASQDKNVRVWKLGPKKGALNGPESKGGAAETALPGAEPLVELEAYSTGPTFLVDGVSWQASLESLLVGHEDWVHSVQWQPSGSAEAESTEQEPQKRNRAGQPTCLLSASMDRSMLLWRPDPKTGLWICEVSVGEFGHTALGFWGGLWSPEGDAILAHGFGGSLHLWRKSASPDSGEQWTPQLVPSGHSGPVSDVSWDRTGSFVLLAGSWHAGNGLPIIMQWTTNLGMRLLALRTFTYVSGAEEKVARVFEAPLAFLNTLRHTTAGGQAVEEVHVLGANMSALGLSQRPIYAGSQAASDSRPAKAKLDITEDLPDARPLALSEPPLEEHLAQNTLWPETHKLYGHGNELFCMAADHHGIYLATACKASTRAQSAREADVLLWEMESWRVVGKLAGHTLTVTQIEFSWDDRFILCVSRDRQLSVFQAATESRDVEQPGQANMDNSPYVLLDHVAAHKRIVWTGSWAPASYMFATGSRDKLVKFWEIATSEDGSPVNRHLMTLPVFRSSVTATACSPSRFSDGSLVLAVGTEEGSIEVWKMTLDEQDREGPTSTASRPEAAALTDSIRAHGQQVQAIVHCTRLVSFDVHMCHVAAVLRLRWQKVGDSRTLEERPEADPIKLASSGADHSVRIFEVSVRV